jgi:hypothetical protein
LKPFGKELGHEEIVAHGRADCVCAEAGGDGHAGCRGDPPDGISEQTFYRWKKVYGGLGVGELRRVKQLEEENRKLKQLVADLSLDKHILQDVLAKKALTPGRRREIVAHVQASHGISERRSCSALGVEW